MLGGHKMKKTNYINQVISGDGFGEFSIEDVKNFVELCNKKDNTELNLYLNDKAEDITKFLLQDENKLIVYLATKPSFKKGECYIWGAIHPDYRSEANFEEFFNLVKDTSKDNNVSGLKCFNERKVTYFREFLIRSGGEEKYSDYGMDFDRKGYKEGVKVRTDLVIRKSTIEDVEHMTKMGMEAFDTDEDDERRYNESIFKKAKWHPFVGVIDGIPVGMVTAAIEDGESSIADFAVLKDYRGKGIGKTILSSTIDFILKEGIEKIKLSVETKNENALSLYKDNGFSISKVTDIYEIKL